ncbi:L-lysine 6-oxidase [compost metagenome]
MALQIHPSVGVARLGNSPINAVPSPVIAVSPNDPSNICLSPDTIGGLPFNGDGNGPIVKFKDDAGRIKRQGQLFRVFKTLIVDSGSRTISGRDSSVGFDKDNNNGIWNPQFKAIETLTGAATLPRSGSRSRR